MAAILLRHQYIQVSLRVACSAGVFWVGETLLVELALPEPDSKNSVVSFFSSVGPSL